MFTMFFLVKLTIAIVIVCGILSPILASPHNKLSTLFWKIPNAFWIFLICIYFAIAMAVLIESSEQTRIRRQQYFQQYEVPNETHKNVVIENSIGFAPIFPDICYHLTHYKPAAADIPVASDNPAHYADAIRYNARTPLQGSLLPLTRLVWA